MKTNKLIPLILTAALALSACASAADSATTAAPAETAAATPEPTVAPEPVGELHALAETGQDQFGNAIYQVRFSVDDEGSFSGTTIYKTDLDAGQTSLFYEYHDTMYTALYQFLANDTLYVVMYRDDSDTKLLAVPLDGGEVWEIPLGPNTWSARLYDDRYIYCISYSQAPTSPTCGMRLDLQTGESEKWDIPIETYDVLGVTDGGIVTSRIVSDYPIPLPSDSEMRSAIMQNSTLEFDLTDAATGQPIQKIFESSFNGTREGDETIQYSYMGKNGSDYYFLATHLKPISGNPYGDTVGSSVLCVHSDGTQENLDFMVTQQPLREMHQNEEIRWFIAPTSYDADTYIVYDLQGNEIGRTAAPTGVDFDVIEYLLDDGRVVLSLGDDPAHNYVTRYATIDADAFLNGSTEYTEMEFVG